MCVGNDRMRNNQLCRRPVHVWFLSSAQTGTVLDTEFRWFFESILSKGKIFLHFVRACKARVFIKNNLLRCQQLAFGVVLGASREYINPERRAGILHPQPSTSIFRNNAYIPDMPQLPQLTAQRKPRRPATCVCH